MPSPSLLRGDACVAPTNLAAKSAEHDFFAVAGARHASPPRSLECHDLLAYGPRGLERLNTSEPVSHTYRVHGLTLQCQFPLPELTRRQVSCRAAVDISVRTGFVHLSDIATPTPVPYLHLVDNAAMFTFEDTGRYCVRDGSD